MENGDNIKHKILNALAMLKSFKLTQSDIANELKDQNYQISQSELSKVRSMEATSSDKDYSISPIKLEMIEKGLDEILFAKNYIYDYNQLQYKLNLEEKNIAYSDQSLKLRNFENTTWYLYFFDKQYLEGVLKNAITRVVFEIGANQQVSLQNVKNEGYDPKNTDYEGILELQGVQHLICNLKTKKTREKHLHIKIIIGLGEVHDINMGVYANINFSGSIVSGTLLLERVYEEEESKIVPQTYIETTEEYEKLDKHIKEYFEHKELNRIKVKTGLNSQSELIEWMNLKKSSKNYKPFKLINTIRFKHDIFISAPMASLEDKKKYERQVEDIKKIKNTLENDLGYNNTFFAGLDDEDNERIRFRQPDIAFQIAIEAMENSGKILFIYPEEITSSSLMEVGWALKSGKLVVIFKRKGVPLPFLLRNIGQVDRKYVNVRVYEYDEKEYGDIVFILKNNGKAIFDE